MPARDSQSVIAGADGRYEFTALPGGSYFVAATGGFERATHLTHVFGDPRPIEAVQALVGKTFVLHEGEIREDVDISLVRALAIDGRVVDPDGEPMAGVAVTASAIDRSVWLPVSGSTDDRGMFRLYGLPATAYRVCADPKRGGMDAHLLTDRTERLVKTCVPEDSNGQPVVVSGASAPHVEIAVRAHAAFSVSGAIVDAAGAPVRDAGASLTRIGGDDKVFPGVVDSTGRFTIAGVTPGRYVLGAYTPSRLGLPRKGEAIAGYLPVTVDSGNVEGLTVQVARGAVVRGHVTFLDGPAPRAGSYDIQVQAAVDGPSMLRSPTLTAHVDDRLSFELADLFLPSRIVVARLPAGWGLKAIRYRGRDIHDVPVRFETDPDPRALDVQLTSKVAELTGTVVDGSGAQAIVPCVVALSSDSPSSLPAMAVAPATPDGTRYRFADLPAGEYGIAAVPLWDCSRIREDPAVIEELRPLLQQVTLEAGEHRVLDLPLSSLPIKR